MHVGAAWGQLARAEVALPESLDIRCGVDEFVVGAGIGVRVDRNHSEPRGMAEVVDRGGKVGVFGHDDGLLVVPSKPPTIRRVAR